MPYGNEVNVYGLNAKAATAVIELRAAFDKVEAVTAFLGNHPRPEGQPDPLIEMFQYTAGEAYNLRTVFEALAVKKAEMDPILNVTARQITGLE